MNIVDKIARELRWRSVKRNCETLARDNSIWVFGEWMGEKCCDNCLYLANYIAESREDLSLIWIASDGVDTSRLASSVTVLSRGSEDALAALHAAGVAVFNQGLIDFCDDWGYHTAGALNVDLWHGVPWKLIGLDSGKRSNFVRRCHSSYIANLRKPDVFLAPSPEFERIAKTAFKMEDDDFIRAGYPRNSCLYDGGAIDAARKKLFDALQNACNARFDNWPIVIAYMPTFRDAPTQTRSFARVEAVDKYNKFLDDHNAIIVEKSHFVDEVRDKQLNRRWPKRVFPADGLTAQELLCSADVLITDYSSCFFDYLLVDRPIIHYLYDYTNYRNTDRGLYYTPDDVVCGDVAYDDDELLRFMELNIIDPKRCAALRAERRAKYMKYESGASCEEIVRQIELRLNAEKA